MKPSAGAAAGDAVGCRRGPRCCGEAAAVRPALPPAALPGQDQLVERGLFLRDDVQESLGGIHGDHAPVGAAIVTRR